MTLNLSRKGTRKLVLEIRAHRFMTGLSNLLTNTHHSSSPVGSSTIPLVEDVLVYILDHFLTTPDLSTLCLVSRRLNTLATPTLYANIHLLPIQFLEKMKNLKRNIGVAQRRILMTLSDQPHLSLYVRNLAWFIEPKDDDVSLYQFISGMKNLQQLHICTLYRSPQAPIQLSQSISSVTLDGSFYLGFFLSIIHLRHLKTLVLAFTPLTASVITDWMADTKPTFPCLTHLHLRLPRGIPVPPFHRTGLLKKWKQMSHLLRGSLQHLTLGLHGPTARSQTHSLSRNLESELLPVFFEEHFPHLHTLVLEGLAQGDSSIRPECLDKLRATIPSVIVRGVDAKLSWMQL
ncbi:hypothetical protein K439DRAFT_1634608 [Ramaria rubella]|nr:hypothetical protein K439DRAFT_1634608 [Ramaria rubella]